MNRKKWIFIQIVFVLFGVICLTGCQIKKVGEIKRKDISFTVCDEGRLPKELVKIIQSKKKEPFKMTYRTKDYMYIVVGYGAQDREDIAISVTDCYLTQNGIIVDTKLIADSSKKLANNSCFYPYVAIKCELYEEEVIFR